jgi:hypothetical protein
LREVSFHSVASEAVSRDFRRQRTACAVPFRSRRPAPGFTGLARAGNRAKLDEQAMGVPTPSEVLEVAGSRPSENLSLENLFSMPENRIAMYRVLYSLIILLVLSLIVLLHTIPVETARFLIRENSVIENLSAAGWFLAGYFAIRAAGETGWTDGYLAGILLSLCGFRELDFHNCFTTLSITKKAFYLSPEVPLPEKGIAVFLWLFILFILYRLSLKNVPILWGRLREKDPPSLMLLLGLALLPLSKVIESLPNTLKGTGILSQEDLVGSMSIFEEVLEMGIPYLLLVVLFHFAGRSGSREGARQKIASSASRPEPCPLGQGPTGPPAGRQPLP